MTELPPFPDLATPAAEETAPPPFERLVATARVRRRRRAAAVAGVAAAVVVAAASTAALSVGHDAAPLPVAPAPSPSLPSPFPLITHWRPPSGRTAARITAIMAKGQAYDVAADEEGAQLTMWARPGASDAVWQERSPDGAFWGLVHLSSPDVVTADKGFLLRGWDGDPVLVNLSGDATRLRRVDTGALQPYDVEVVQGKTLGLADPDTGTWWPLEPAAQIEGTVSSDGTVWASVPNMAVVADSRDGRTWRTFPLDSDPGQSEAVYVTTYGPSLVAAYSAAADPGQTLRTWAVSHDGGATWTRLSAAQLPFGEVRETAVTPKGVLFVRSQAGLWRSTDDTWTRFARVPVPGGLVQITPGPDGILGRFGTPRRPIVRAIDDSGVVTPWTPSAPR